MYENNVDPDKLASLEAIPSGLTLFNMRTMCIVHVG